MVCNTKKRLTTCVVSLIYKRNYLFTLGKNYHTLINEAPLAAFTM
jgi:hypothetical protein